MKCHSTIPIQNTTVTEQTTGAQSYLFQFFRVKLVEKAGTGTTDMIADCLAAGLPEPEFRQCGPHFVTTLRRDWLTESKVTQLGLSERQRQAVQYVRTNGQITSGQYQELTGVEARTATRDLDGLVEKSVLIRRGRKRGASYALRKK